MGKEDEKIPTKGKEDENDPKTGEKGEKIKELGVVRHIHELLEKTPKKEGDPEKTPDKVASTGAGEGDKDPDKIADKKIDDKIDENAEAIEKAEKEKKAYEENIAKLEKRLTTYQKKEETDKIADIESHIADLKKSAGEKDVLAERLKKINEELTTTKGKLGERETQLGAIAMKAFNEEKDALVEAVKKDLGEDKAKEIAEKITTPQQLEEVKGWLKVFTEVLKKKDAKEGDDKEGSVDLSKTGGKIPLKAPSRGEFEQGRDVINALYDAYEKELYKKETGKEFDVAKLIELDEKINKIWSSVLEGIGKRGGKVLGSAGEFDVRTCQYCHRVFFGDKAECPYCKKSVQPWERGRSSAVTKR